MINCKHPPGRPKKFLPHLNLKRKRYEVGESQIIPVNEKTHLIVSAEKQEEIALIQTTAPTVSNIQEENVVAMVDDSPSTKEDMTTEKRRLLPSRVCKELTSTLKDRKVLEGCSSKQQSSGNRLVNLDSLVSVQQVSPKSFVVCRSETTKMVQSIFYFFPWRRNVMP